ncbi:hypothetical protein LPJ55_004068 [Coemansia sp. RSA 990]|nr:P-loop containing nucleoside triphosphate hydrolase protein [Coemansia mojavensis]KAJ1871190.1 hypothetical protein LPJ55_004068 [Coemansia sp. RSA 990]
MQQINAILFRQAVRVATRLSVSKQPSFFGAPICTRMQALKLSLPSSMRSLASAANAYAESEDASSADPKAYEPVPFSSYGNIHPLTMKSIQSVMKFEAASKVQHQIVSQMPFEKDIMIKAKTGTGKTIAFLIPVIEALAKEYAANRIRGKYGREVGCLVISPTRELAKQLAAEATKLVRFHGWGVQLLVGGESSRMQTRDLQTKRADIVVATPGRLLDFMQNNSSFAKSLSELRTLVLDEADMLLEMGFRKELDLIFPMLPTERSTCLVSATLDRSVMDLTSTALNSDFEMIDCVGKEEVNTHRSIKQEYIQADYSQHLPVLCDLIRTHTAECKANNHGSKIVVFIPTVKSTDFYASMITGMLARGRDFFGSRNPRSREPRERLHVQSLHGGLSQNSRSRRSDNFRHASFEAGQTSVLVTTDVSARGVDYPNVTMVIQIGIPSQPEAYVHRIGRTGRAGKAGEGVILLTPMEVPFLQKVKDVVVPPSEKYTRDYIKTLCDFKEGPLSDLASRWDGLAMNMDPEAMERSFTSLLAYYVSKANYIGHPDLYKISGVIGKMYEPFGEPVPELSPKLQAALGAGGARFRNSSGSRDRNRFGNRDNSRFGSSGNNRFGGGDNNRFNNNRFGNRENSRFGSNRFGNRDNNRFGSRDNRFGNNRFDNRDNSRSGRWNDRGDDDFGGQRNGGFDRRRFNKDASKY